MVTDESAKVYLANKVAKAKSTMLEIDADVHAKTKEIEGLQRLLDAYKRSPNAGDPFDVNEVWQVRCGFNV